MKKSAKFNYPQFFKDDQGVALVEYALALTVAIIVGTGAIVLLGADVAVEMREAVVSMPD